MKITLPPEYPFAPSKNRQFRYKFSFQFPNKLVNRLSETYENEKIWFATTMSSCRSYILVCYLVTLLPYVKTNLLLEIVEILNHFLFVHLAFGWWHRGCATAASFQSWTLRRPPWWPSSRSRRPASCPAPDFRSSNGKCCDDWQRPEVANWKLLEGKYFIVFVNLNDIISFMHSLKWI